MGFYRGTLVGLLVFTALTLVLWQFSGSSRDLKGLRA